MKTCNGVDFSECKISEKMKFRVSGCNNKEIQVSAFVVVCNSTYRLLIEINKANYVLIVKFNSGDETSFSCDFVSMVSSTGENVTHQEFNALLNYRKHTREYMISISHYVNGFLVHMNEDKVLGQTVFEYEECQNGSNIILLFSEDNENISAAIEVVASCNQNTANIDEVNIL